MNKGKSRQRIAMMLTSFTLGVGAFSGLGALTALAYGIEIKCPSNTTNDQETTIAPGRDFYVTGSITLGAGEALANDAEVIVELWRTDGNPQMVRWLHTTIKNNTNGIYTNWFFPAAGNRGTMYNAFAGANVQHLQNSLMPDLVYDPNVPNSVLDPWRKVTFTETYFGAKITGFNNPLYTTFADQQGHALTPLTSGNYQIKVFLLDQAGNLLADDTRNITLAYPLHITLGRFGPATHKTKMVAFARANNYKTLLDPLAGMWAGYGQLGINTLALPEFYEIYPLWREVDSTQYQGGSHGTNTRVHYFAYNIKEDCATYNVEIGRMQDEGIIDASLEPIRYSTGEPYPIGSATAKSAPAGTLQPFNNVRQNGQIDKLDLTRVDLPSSTPGQNPDNKMDTAYGVMNALPTDANLTNGVRVPRTKWIAINGVVSPIQNTHANANTPGEIVYNADKSYIIMNRVASVRYSFTRQGATSATLTISKPVAGLQREGGEYTTASTSIIEFRHFIQIPQTWIAGTYIVKAVGIDVHGNVVANSTEQFELEVT